MREPRGITAGSDGNIWFTNYANHSIGRITPAGVVSSFTDPAILYPGQIVAGADGNLWFTNSFDIGRITVDGVVSTFGGVDVYRYGIAAGPDGNLWLTTYSSPFDTTTAIGRLTPSGVVSNFTDPGIVEPTGMAAGPDGDLWFTNAGRKAQTQARSALGN
jgi:streptogramin lyase